MGDNMMLDSDRVKVTVDGAEYTDYKISQGTSTQDFVISNLPDKNLSRSLTEFHLLIRQVSLTLQIVQNCVMTLSESHQTLPADR